jgi:hypothetical protein
MTKNSVEVNVYWCGLVKHLHWHARLAGGYGQGVHVICCSWIVNSVIGYFVHRTHEIDAIVNVGQEDIDRLHYGLLLKTKPV